MGLSQSLPRSSTQIQAWPVHQTRPKSRCRLRQADRHKCRAVRSARTVRGSVVSSLAFPPRSPTSQLRPLSFFLCRITFSFLFHARLSKPVAVLLTAESPPHKSRSPTRRAGRLSHCPKNVDSTCRQVQRLSRQIQHCPSFDRSLRNMSTPRERPFSQTEPVYEAFVRSLRSHPEHASRATVSTN